MKKYLFAFIFIIDLLLSNDYSINFDGQNDFINISDHSDLDLTNNYTLEAWIFSESFSWLAGIISKYQTNAANGYILRLTSQSPYSGIGFDEKITSTGVLNANQWHHIAAVNNNGQRKLYIDGILTTISGSPLNVTSNSDPIRLGSDYSSRFFRKTMATGQQKVLLSVVGNLDDPGFHQCRLLAEAIADEFSPVSLDVRALVHTDYEDFVLAKSKELGAAGNAEAYNHTSSPFVFYNGCNYIGGVRELAVWARRVYDITINKDASEYEAIAKDTKANFMQESKYKAVLFANTLWFIHNFKIPLVEELIKKNFEIEIIYIRLGPPVSNKSKELFKSIRIYTFCDYIFFSLKRILFNKNKSKRVLFSFTIGPILLSVLPLFNSFYKYATLEGLGRVFSSRMIFYRFLKRIIQIVYKIIFLNYYKGIFVLNYSDYAFLLEKKIVQISKLFIIPGTGIDSKIFNPSNLLKYRKEIGIIKNKSSKINTHDTMISCHRQISDIPRTHKTESQSRGRSSPSKDPILPTKRQSL